MTEIAEIYKESFVKFSLTNVEVWWCHIHEPDTKFGQNKYKLEMRLEDKVAKQLLAEGFAVKDKEDKEGNIIKNVLNAKKEVKKKNGENNKPPVVVGRDGRTPFTDPIGNGSIVNLNLTAKAWKIRGDWILSCYVDGVQVVDHVAYAGGFAALDGEDAPF